LMLYLNSVFFLCPNVKRVKKEKEIMLITMDSLNVDLLFGIMQPLV
jgi:hypothetical protein